MSARWGKSETFQSTAKDIKFQSLPYLERFAMVQNQLMNVQKEISVSMAVPVSRVYLIFFFTVKATIHKVKVNGLILRKSNKKRKKLNESYFELPNVCRDLRDCPMAHGTRVTICTDTFCVPWDRDRSLQDERDRDKFSRDCPVPCPSQTQSLI